MCGKFVFDLFQSFLFVFFFWLVWYLFGCLAVIVHPLIGSPAVGLDSFTK